MQFLMAVFLGLVFGAVITWLALKGQRVSAVETAVIKAQSESQYELSQLRERSNTLESSLQKSASSLSELNAQLDRRREELDQARDDVSRLSERVARVENLENSLSSSSEQLRRQSEELRQITAEASEKASLAHSNSQRADALEKSLNETMSQFRLVTSDVNTLTGIKATLEEQASRVKPLEDELANVRLQLQSKTEELRSVSAEASEKGSLAQSNSEKAISLENDLIQLRSQLAQAVMDVKGLIGQKATLEEQASRIKPLEEELFNSEQRLRDVQAVQALSNERRAALEEQSLRIPALEDELRQAKLARSDAESNVTRLTAEVSQLSTQLQAELKSSQEKLTLLEDAKNTLSEQFKNVANDILEEKSKKFSEQNQTNLGQLLDPLRQQIHEFKGKVEEVYVQESKDRSAMAEQVRQLASLNQALSQEAKNLTNALKGNTKTQGNWGELVLERVLEASGLRKGMEYIVQDSQTREDGSRAQPDVVIMLPEQRKLVVDSKVSLNAYEEYTVANSEDERVQAVRRHLDSVRKHVLGLSAKSYEKLYRNGLDFVLMFVPIEPAFMLSISNDERLFMEAWDRNVLLVSPSTLLFVVRTVAHLWRQEQQSRNAQDIAKRGAELYDRLVDFVKDLEQVGTRLKQARESYDDAHKRLTTGKGNVIRQAEMLRELGVKATKKLPSELVEIARGELTSVEELAAIAEGIELSQEVTNSDEQALN
ncbi:DNA recombination protein RmuC [Limnohabitans sp. DM1]|uniref:DNA recombination protein RmuC n=1 Tax=Limnohabitans sp. DM1 TaxID=1597955 RepID=UPI000B1B401B|nr:DNA recombination protein RmuC [Limnohabitans sp. DM1]